VGGGQLVSLFSRLSGSGRNGFAFGWHLRSRVSILHWSAYVHTMCVLFFQRTLREHIMDLHTLCVYGQE
jgi:hypothetical protein